MISNRPFQWKLNLNLDTANQAKEVRFNRKTQIQYYYPLFFQPKFCQSSYFPETFKNGSRLTQDSLNPFFPLWQWQN